MTEDKIVQKWILNEQNVKPFIEHIERYRNIQPLIDQVEMGNPLLVENEDLKELLAKALRGQLKPKRGNQAKWPKDIIYDLVWEFSERDTLNFDNKKPVFDVLAFNFHTTSENIKRIFYNNRDSIEKAALSMWQLKHANLEQYNPLPK